MLVLRCPIHPMYKAVRKPKVPCKDCEELYLKEHPLEKKLEDNN